ncbi:alpha-galactosidase [Paenibacillus sp. J5C_2022]|uniref:glycoside hydrolase family 36 protein n=1 Tax=Paenibacillus sp. J5C2022 TaxID=2977129 RepID=UPI0021D3387E|nr:glycoside hydrolase family 36 protein [Paenibacillus sp. J5C2022]MCU6707509.1 alpha-galactosidase [Paenibacillus sp. J5C2022]
MTFISTGTHRFTLSGVDERFRIQVVTEKEGDGVDLIHIMLDAKEATVPAPLTISWEHPADDIGASWHPAADRNKSFKADWMREYRSNAATSAPVHSLFSANGSNRLTFAYSDALHTVHYRGAIREESAMFQLHVRLFQEQTAPLDHYVATLRMDTRDIPYYDCLTDASDWWSRMAEYRPAHVPETARSAMYSTWYSMHQNVTAAEVEAECRLARPLGMEAVIVDDGWQTSDNQRGYAYTGDWQPCPEKFPDMREHVEAIHALGMRIMLWYAVPFVGKHSEAWHRYKDKFLRYSEGMGAGVVDPRYPEVREYIIGTYERAITDWNLDGFKLDFVDQFYSPDRETPSDAPGRDYDSVPAAVDRLLTECISRLRQLKPDVMIEFRQPYIGPAMRKYGNMFRASDCPNDSIQNRVRTLDIRLLCGNTAAHADMMMWHPQEPAESAALQLINALFSVPQVSMKLADMTDGHRRMTKHWLSFWNDNRDQLLDGKLAPLHPELLYPCVIASGQDRAVIVTYYDSLVTLPEPSSCKEWSIVNGRLEAGVYARLQQPAGEAEVVIRDCYGDVVHTFNLMLSQGAHELPIPPSGSARICLRQS